MVPLQTCFHDYEVKWRSQFTVSVANKKRINEMINRVLRKERLDKIGEIIGNQSCEHIFVTTRQHFGRTEKKRNHVKRQFEKHGIEIRFFDDIIRQLVSKIEVKGRYDSPILQTIRMLKYFKITKEQEKL